MSFRTTAATAGTILFTWGASGSSYVIVRLRHEKVPYRWCGVAVCHTALKLSEYVCGEEITSRQPTQVKRRCVRCNFTVHVWVHNHLVIEAIDAVVEHRGVRSDVDTWRTVQLAEEHQRVVDLGRDRLCADPFVDTALDHRRRVAVAK